VRKARAQPKKVVDQAESETESEGNEATYNPAWSHMVSENKPNPEDIPSSPEYSSNQSKTHSEHDSSMDNVLPRQENTELV
jgi:hypothetical protein